jgi:adenine-specific DNA-methyltransferase
MLALTDHGFEELFDLLFPEERADLDFGFYRLLNTRRDALRRFFREDLPAMLADFAKSASVDDEIASELSLLQNNAIDLGITAEQISRYNQLQRELAEAARSALASETIRHLSAFIRRYYVDGDFIPMRRHRSDAYFVPYDGSETSFIYANQDQYFTKSDQLFQTFRVRLSDERRVTCTVSYAEERLGNNDDNTKRKRRYQLHAIDISDAEIILRFAFVPTEKATQTVLTADAVERIHVQTRHTAWFSELFRLGAESKPWITRFVERFTKSTEQDYFVHKNLYRFLTEELDRYVFTDIFPRATIRDDRTLRMASRTESVLRGVAEPLVRLLAQFEDLQRDLWTKPRLVTETVYCLTLDRVPADLVPIVVRNEGQRAEWMSLYGISSEADIAPTSHPGLFVDTRHFDKTFFAQIEAALPNGDDGLDGLVVVSENTSALRTYMRRLAKRVDAIYIDPPFNTGSGSSFRYRNGYQHSSWCCLLQDALALGGQMLTSEGVMAIAIDDAEVARLQMLADRVFGEQRRLGTQVFVTKHGGRSRDRFFATSHEYALYYASADAEAAISFAPLTEEQRAQYKFVDADSNRYKWRDFMRTGGLSLPRERPHSHYNIFWHPVSNAVIVFADPDRNPLTVAKAVRDLASFLEIKGASKRSDLGDADAYVFLPEGAIIPDLGEFVAIKAVDSSGGERVWRKTRLPFMIHVAKGEIQFSEEDGKYKVHIKDPEKRGTRPNSVADDKSFNATAYGTKLLQNMFGKPRVFSYPKALNTVKRSLEIMVGDDEEAVVCDYFAGSGTTGHAVIEMNRDGGNRRYILVEMAEYVDEVTIPRLKKAAYASTWSNGRPAEADSISHTMKIVRLESFEDALENVARSPTEKREQTLSLFPEFRREFVPARLLRDDVRTSRAFLPEIGLDAAAGIEISVLDHNGKRRMVAVDLSETLSIWLGLDVERRVRGDGIEVTIGKLNEVRTALVVRDSACVDSQAVLRSLKHSLGESKVGRLIINGDVSNEVLRRGGIDAEIQTVEETIVAWR